MRTICQDAVRVRPSLDSAVEVAGASVGQEALVLPHVDDALEHADVALKGREGQAASADAA